MKRLCFLSPDVDHTRRVVAALRRAGVDNKHLMVIARHDIPLEDLPAASVIDKTDALPGFARGLAAGGVIGTLAGLLVLSFEDVGLALGGAAIPLFALFGAGVSGLATLLAGASLPSSRLHQFQTAIERDGKLLLMVDAQDEQVEHLRELVQAETSQVEFAGVEPHVPIVPP